MKFPARILAVFFAFVLIFSFLKPSFAQETTQSNNYLAPDTDANVSKNLHNYTQSALIETMSAFICQLSGIDPINPKQGCLGINPKTNKIGYTEKGGGALGLTIQGIGMLFTPPVHTSDFISYATQSFGVAKPSYAQGIGFKALSPLINIWTIFRNLTYLIFVIAFILIGVGIMLRARIDPRTVMGIQNQIPKIIIALILITFSFAIVGLLIDLMFFSMYLIYSLFSGLPGLNTSLSPASIEGQTILNAAGNLNIFGIVNNIAVAGKDSLNAILIGPSSHSGLTGGAGSIMDMIGKAFNFGVGDWINFSVVDMLYNVASIYGALKFSSLIPCAGSGVPFVGGLLCTGQTAIESTGAFLGIHFFFTDILPFLIIWLIVIVGVLITLFRILLMLLRSYVSLLLDVVFAPIWIIGALIPGNSSLGFGPWLKDVVANLAVFPTVYGMILLANVIGAAMSAGPSNAAPNGSFTPPLLGNSLAPGFLGAITSLGLLFMTPEAAKMIKSAIKAPKTGFGLGGALGPATGIIAAPIRRINHEIFGENRRGEAKIGRAVISNKFAESRVGLRFGQFRERVDDAANRRRKQIRTKLGIDNAQDEDNNPQNPGNTGGTPPPPPHS